MTPPFALIVAFGLTISLSWTATPVIGLTDTNWALVKIIFQTTNQTQTADTSCGTILRFDNNGSYTGFSGWNEYMGKYSIADYSQVRDDIDGYISMKYAVSTKRGGDSKCKLGETLYDHFPKTKKYLIKMDTLFLWTSDSVQIAFRKN